MTVAELIEKLKEMPQEMVIATPVFYEITGEHENCPATDILLEGNQVVIVSDPVPDECVQTLDC